MSATPKSPVIIQGEASESDDDNARPAVQAVNKLTPPVPKQKEMDSGYNLKLKVRMEKQVKANYKYRKSLREDKKNIGKLKQFQLNQKKYDKIYKEKSWNEAKKDPALHKAMMCQQRLKVQKSRMKEQLEHGQLSNEKREEMLTAFEKISKELKELTPQIQHLRKNLRQRSQNYTITEHNSSDNQNQIEISHNPLDKEG